MLTNLKAASIVHMAVLKLAAAKTAIGVGMVVGAATTGILVTDGLKEDYVNAAGSLMSEFGYAEMGESPVSAGPLPEVPLAVSGQGNEPSASASIGGTDFGDASVAASEIPQVVITAKRMSQAEKIAYDLEVREQLLALFH